MANSKGNFFEKTKRGRGRVKHAILDRYLKAWFPKIGQTYFNSPLVYIDGFAGPGKYVTADGEVELGSPIVAYRAAIDHFLLERFKAGILLIFVELSREKAKLLKEALDTEARNKCPEKRKIVKYEVYCQEFAPFLEEFMERPEFKRSPMLVFADPFGYKGIPNRTLQKLLGRVENNATGYPLPTELFITVMDSFARRFISDSRKGSALTELMGHETNWHHLTNENYTPEERRTKFIDLYIKNLTAGLSTPRSLKFSIRDKRNIHTYHLVFVTTHPSGIRSMKSSMWNQSFKVSELVFSEFDEVKNAPQFPKDKKQVALIVRDKVFAEFAGKSSVSGQKIEEFMLDDPAIFLNCKIALKALLKHYQINPEVRKFAEIKYDFPNLQIEVASTSTASMRSSALSKRKNKVSNTAQTSSSSTKYSDSDSTVPNKKLRLNAKVLLPKVSKKLTEPSTPVPIASSRIAQMFALQRINGKNNRELTEQTQPLDLTKSK